MNNTFWPERAAVPTPESFIHLGQKGFHGQGRKSRVEKRANPRAEGKANSRTPVETPSISLIVHLG